MIMPDWVNALPYVPILIAMSLLSLFIGIFLICKPMVAIEIQRRFYEKINWRFEPISMEKEIRNTRIMGLILVALPLATTVFLILNPPQI